MNLFLICAIPNSQSDSPKKYINRQRLLNTRIAVITLPNSVIISVILSKMLLTSKFNQRLSWLTIRKWMAWCIFIELIIPFSKNRVLEPWLKVFWSVEWNILLWTINFRLKTETLLIKLLKEKKIQHLFRNNFLRHTRDLYYKKIIPR